MSMRGIQLSFELDFDTPEDQADSEDALVRLMGLNARLNAHFLRKNPDTLPLYSSGIVYTRPDQADGRRELSKSDRKELLALLKKLGADPETALMVLRLMKGVEVFMDIPTLYARGKGDCNELVPVRIAELWRAGIMASPYLIKSPAPNDRGGISYHAVVLWPDGSAEDVSMVLGMGGPDNAPERAEEVRKNIERWDGYMAAAQRLIQAEGASPVEAGKYVDAIGLVPSDGVFRSPYRRST